MQCSYSFDGNEMNIERSEMMRTTGIKMKIKKLTSLLGITVLITICRSENTFGQLPAATQIAAKMKIGWNLGNSLEAPCSETAWGGARITQLLIDSVKAAGFNAVRIPCAWFCHSDTVNSKIETSWMARVKEVVDYCINDSLYVILNMHWDKGWLENRVDTINQPIVNVRMKAYWAQIAAYFKNYNEYLLFAAANEPNVKDSTGMSVLLSYYQTFVNTVRATGKNNSSRTLIIQGPSTDVDNTFKLMDQLPKDKIEDRLMVEVHYYTPWQFCGETSSKGYYYWGKNYHSLTDIEHNAKWGEESTVDEKFALMKKKFVDKGIPVIIGEFAAFRKRLPPSADSALHNASIEYFHKYAVSAAKKNGIVTFYWDVDKDLFNRKNGKILDHGILNAIKEGAKQE